MKKVSQIIGAVLAVALLVFPYGAMILLGLADEFIKQLNRYLVIVLVVLYVLIACASIVWAIVWSVTGGESEWILLWNLLIRSGYLLVWCFMGLFFVVGLIVWYIGGKETVMQICEIGALLLVTPGVYGICGNILAVKERYISTGLAVAMSILQFIPGIDLITAIVTYCIVNTRRKKRQNQQIWTNRV